MHDVFEKGDTYPHPPGTDEESAYAYWMASPTASYVALVRDSVVGSYYLRPNQPGLGAHVGNAGYIVKSAARGKGIGTAMGRHSLVEAKRLGFKALQFNLVVSTNAASIRLWKKLNFNLAGTLAKAFKHREKGYVDALVMYRLLDDIQV